MFRKLERGAQILGLSATFILALSAGAVAQKGRGAPVDQYTSKIKEKSSALDSIKTELQRGRARIEELQKEEGNYLSQLEQVEENIETSENYLQELSGRIDTLNLRIEKLRYGRDSAQSALASRQLRMRTRIRTMYMTGNPDLGQIILGSANVTDMLNRGKYFLELKRYDQDLIRHIDSTRAMLTRATLELEETRQQYLGLKQDKQAEQQQLVQEKSSRASMLKEIQQEKAANIAMVKELEQAQRELNLLLQTLEKQRKQVKRKVETASPAPATSFEKSRGKLPWPVQGAIVKDFGRIVHPVYKTVTMSVGVDIKTEAGEAVACVAPGRIDYVGRMRGYGKFVIVNHSSGYLTIYTHLDSVAVSRDQAVDGGDVLGTVGETGSLEGSRLHFEIRKSTEALNPREWLEKQD